MRRTKPTNEEIRSAVDRAESHYYDHIQHQLTEDDKDRYIAIDGKSLEWEIGDTDEVMERLRARVPDAVIHMIRHITIVSAYFGAAPDDLTQEKLQAMFSRQLADAGEEFGQ